jgi:hypothetical protein
MEINQFISCLHQSKQQAIVWHHQTTSFSEHKALNFYYEGIEDLVDSLVESIQGVYPRITLYTLTNPIDWKEGKSISYFQELYDYVKRNRTEIPQQESWVQNQIDEVAQLIAETLYQLSLK